MKRLGMLLVVLLLFWSRTDVRGEISSVLRTGETAAEETVETSPEGTGGQSGADYAGAYTESVESHSSETVDTSPGETGALSADESAGRLQEELLSEIDLTEIQNMIDELLGKGSFSVSESLKRIISGEEALSREGVARLLRSFLFSRLSRERGQFLRVILLILLAAVFFNFATIFDNGQVGDISFYVVYLVLFMLLMESFSELVRSLSESLSWIAEFMRSLAPAYFIAIAASVGASTAAMFYEGVLLLVWLIQWVLVNLLLPGVQLYILLCLINHLSREEMLGKLSDLLKTLISWGLNTLLGLVAGLQIVRSLVSPVIDSLKRSALGKTASVIPGVGNAINMVTEIVVTSAVLVRNSLGAVFLLVFFLAGAGPLLHYGLMSAGYRFLAAVAQPVSDKRIVECLGTMGEGIGLLLKVLITGEVLCMLTFLILMVSFGGGG